MNSETSVTDNGRDAMFKEHLCEELIVSGRYSPGFGGKRLLGQWCVGSFVNCSVI